MSADQTTGYSAWQWLDMNEDEQRCVGLLKVAFNTVAAKAGVQGYTFDIRKASLTISTDEARSGAYHQLADGTPFYRLSVTGPENGGEESMLTVMMLTAAFATVGGSQMCWSDPPEMDIDRREMEKPALDVISLLPWAVAKARAGGPRG